MGVSVGHDITCFLFSALFAFDEYVALLLETR